MTFNDDETDAFYAHNSDRTMAIMYGIMLENRLTDIIKLGLHGDTAVRNELFQPSGALGNFAVKIRLAYVLGLLTREYYEDFINISKIRNGFAHKINVKSFHDQEIENLINKLSMVRILRATVDEAASKAHEDRFSRALHFALGENLKTPRLRYQECIRMYIHWLGVLAEHVKKKVSVSPPSADKS
jgi:hypothetical protein